MLEEIVPFTPVHFFAFSAECKQDVGPKNKALGKGYVLPDLAPFHREDAFASVALAWHEEGIHCTVQSTSTIQESIFPDFQTGDAVELFFDTRDVKTSGFNTRFCHQFFFLAEPVDMDGEVVQAGEITRFRTEDIHELCNAKLLIVDCLKQRKGYTLNIFIPAECLHGYDPAQIDRLGFTYRIHRSGGTPQCFSASSEDFPIEQQPSLWASLKLTK